jgi:hypothetical protein
VARLTYTSITSRDAATADPLMRGDELVDERRFDSGVVYLQHRVSR